MPHFLLAILLTCAAAGLAAEAPVIILKLDDVRGTKDANAVHARWQRTVDILAERDLVGSFGISGKDLATADEAFVGWCRELHESGRIEFWNHGYTHGKRTVDGKDVAEFSDEIARQREAFTKTQTLAKEVLGFPFRAFGSPFNAINADTPVVLAEDPDCTVWLYGNGAHAKAAGFSGLVLGRRLNLEHPVINPDAARFIASYEQLATEGKLPAYLCLQGHPGGWDDRRMGEFTTALDFLIAQGCRFTTPSGYAAELAAAK